MNLTTKKIAIIASLIALAVSLDAICDAIPFLQAMAPKGGGVSLGMLPLFILAYVYGPKNGIIGGVIYALFDILLAGQIYHWASPLLDYILPFGLIGFVGLFKTAMKNNYLLFILGFILVGLERFVLHTISGVLLFESKLWASVVYNAPYVFFSSLLCLILGLVIYKQIQIIFESDLQLEKNE